MISSESVLLLRRRRSWRVDSLFLDMTTKGIIIYSKPTPVRHAAVYENIPAGPVILKRGNPVQAYIISPSSSSSSSTGTSFFLIISSRHMGQVPLLRSQGPTQSRS